MVEQVRYNRDPLIYTIGQVTYGEVPWSINGEIEEALFKHFYSHGFIRKQKEKNLTVEFNPDSGSTSHKTIERLLYLDEARRSQCAIGPDMAVLITTDYDRWAKFAEKFTVLLEALSTKLEHPPHLVRRIGFRHFNAIDLPGHAGNWSQFLIDSLIGLSDNKLFSALPGFSSTSLEAHQARWRTDHGIFQLVLEQHEGYHLMPPETGAPYIQPRECLLRAREAYKQRSKPSTRDKTTILSLDHYSLFAEGYEPEFDDQKVLGQLAALHDTVNTVFRQCLTEKGRKQFGEEEAES